jgi:hypothetical protein
MRFVIKDIELSTTCRTAFTASATKIVRREVSRSALHRIPHRHTPTCAFSPCTRSTAMLSPSLWIHICRPSSGSDQVRPLSPCPCHAEHEGTSLHGMQGRSCSSKACRRASTCRSTCSLGVSEWSSELAQPRLGACAQQSSFVYASVSQGGLVWNSDIAH